MPNETIVSSSGQVQFLQITLTAQVDEKSFEEFLMEQYGKDTQQTRDYLVKRLINLRKRYEVPLFPNEPEIQLDGKEVMEAYAACKADKDLSMDDAIKARLEKKKNQILGIS
jgi:hypothetical protein